VVPDFLGTALSFFIVSRIRLPKQGLITHLLFLKLYPIDDIF